MSIKRANCGANITDDSQFCKYCGAKVDDGIKRVEIKINKRIDNTAEIKRASYEEQESLLRQKIMKQKMLKSKIKWITIGGLALIGLLITAFVMLFGSSNGSILIPIAVMLLTVPISINILVAIFKKM